MSHEGIQLVVNRLAEDPEFREKFRDDRTGALKDVPLSEPERLSMMAVDVDELLASFKRVKKMTRAAVGSIYI